MAWRSGTTDRPTPDPPLAFPHLTSTGSYDPLVAPPSPTCTRGGCSAPATDDGLCTAHHGAQVALRRRLDPERLPPPLYLPRLPTSRPTWHTRAACRGMGPDLFFPPGDDGLFRHVPYSQGRLVCERCPVIDQCAEAGAYEHHGLWAGQSPRQRKRSRTTAEPAA